MHPGALAAGTVPQYHTIPPFPPAPNAFMACAITTLPFIFFIRNKFILADKYESAGKRRFSLISMYEFLLTVNCRLSSTKYKLQPRMTFTVQDQKWSAGRKMKNFLILLLFVATGLLLLAGKYRPVQQAIFLEVLVLLWKACFQTFFITFTRNDRKVFHASSCQDLSDLSKNVQCLRLTILTL